MADVDAGDDAALAAGARPRRPGAPPSATRAGARRRHRRRRCSASPPLDGRPARLLHARCRRRPRAGRGASTRAWPRARIAAPLAGVPVAVKDLICTAACARPSARASTPITCPRRTTSSSSGCARAGAVIVGKTNTSEFGYGAVGHNPLFPTTRNPWNPALTPGGSSAGSAAAVAARMVPLALGSDGGGSVRIPASLRGRVRHQALVGPRAGVPGLSRRALSRHLELGVAGAHRPDHAHAADAALALSVLAGPTPRDRHSLPAESADWRVPGLESLRGRAHRLQHRHGPCGGRRRGRGGGRGGGASPAGSAGRRRSSAPARRSATPRRCSRRWSRSTPTAPGLKAHGGATRRRRSTGWLAEPGRARAGAATSSPRRRWRASASSTRPGASWRVTTSC